MRPRIFALTLAMIPLSAGTVMAITPSELPPGEWQLFSLDGAEVAYRATFFIEEDGRYSGRAPCNRYSGQNGAAWPALSFGQPAVTRMACPELAAEQDFLAALTAVRQAQSKDGRLVMRAGTGPELVFLPLPAAAPAPSPAD